MMGDQRLYRIEGFHTPGASESGRLKVTALNLWEASRYPLTSRFPASRPPDRLSPFPKSRFFHMMTQTLEGEGRGEGDRRKYGIRIQVP
jgi:hypothetical protein